MRADRARRYGRVVLLEAMEPRRLLADVVVNTLIDETVANSTTSLREAVEQANNGDTIVFQSGLSGQITLTGPQILIEKSLNISGPGASTIRVSGNNAQRVFEINPDAVHSVNVSGITIRDGRVSTGGGVYVGDDAQVTFTNVVFTNNTAPGRNGDFGDGDNPHGGRGYGGALYIDAGGQVTINGGSFVDNLAQGGFGGFVDNPDPNRYGNGGDGLGGAIFNDGQLSVNGTSFTNNVARGGEGLEFTQGGRGGDAYGGAIATRATVNAVNATFAGNQALGGDAGDGDFDANVGGNAFGGAIWAGVGALTLAIGNSTLANNVATGGAGGAVTDLIFHYEGGSADGGAVHADGGGIHTVMGNSTLLNNEASGGVGGAGASGGAISVNNGRLTVTNSTLASNKATGTDSFVQLNSGGGAAGGAISILGGLVVSGSTLSDNRVVGGTGANADATRGRQIPAGPGGGASGGAISATSVTINGQPLAISVTRSTIAGNSAKGGQGGSGYDNETWPAGDGGDARGGGVFFGNLGTLTADTIAGNTVVFGLAGEVGDGPNDAVNGVAAGAGVAAAGTNTVKIANTIVAANSVPGGGDVSGAVSSQGFNLIGKTNGSSGWLASDKKGTTAAPLDPKLEALANNGGPTRTMLLLSGSPAIDAGKAFGLTTDQRGQPRTVDLPSVANAVGGDGTDIGAVEVQSTQTSFKTFNIGNTPLTIQNEDFDNGGEGVAYHDTTIANEGGNNYRGSTRVDLKTVQNDTGSVYVGYTKAGEWIEYTVNVQTAGTYNIDFRLASGGGGGKFHLEVDGVDKTGQLTVPNTFGWQNWKTITKTGVALTAGTHVLRLEMDSNGATGSVGNFNYFKFTKTSSSSTTIGTDTAAHVRDGGFANSNFGNAASLEVKKSTSGYNREAYLKFNLASVASIGSAKLRIFGSLDVAGSISLGVYGSSNTGWSEGGLTWNNRNPGATGASALATATVSGATAQWYELDVTSYLQAEKLAGRNTVTLVLRSSTSTSALAKFAADGAVNAPQLVVTS